MGTLRSEKVSVVVPNYNYAKYIGRRLDSILAQTYPIYELIILDDHSSDESVNRIEKKIKKIRETRPEIAVRFVRNQRNSGKAIKQWRKGVEMAGGDYVWIAEADDVAKKSFLSEAMKGFRDKDVVISYTESAIINSVGVMMAPNFRWSRDKERTGHYRNNYIRDGIQEIKEIMAIRCTIPNVSAVVFRKNDKLLQYLKEAEEFSQVGDWYLYLCLLGGGKISYRKKSLNSFRIHKASVTGKSKTGTMHYREIQRIHEMLERKYDLSSMTLNRMRMERIRIKAKHGIME